MKEIDSYLCYTFLYGFRLLGLDTSDGITLDLISRFAPKQAILSGTLLSRTISADDLLPSGS